MRAPLAALILALLATPAVAQERVRVPGPDGVSLDTLVFLPSGEGPHAAVVQLHGCGGRDDRQGRLMARDGDWARWLSARGYLVVLPDSFGSRGVGEQCRTRDRQVTPARERRADALAVRDWLAARPDVRPGAIVLLGFSNGGSTVLHAATAPGFAGFVALYPGCAPVERQRGWAPAAPLLLLIGAADDWTPAAPCAAIAARSPAVTYHAYPGAHHGFDAPNTPVRILEGRAFTADGSGRVHFGTNEPARQDALARVPAFIAAALPR